MVVDGWTREFDAKNIYWRKKQGKEREGVVGGNMRRNSDLGKRFLGFRGKEKLKRIEKGGDRATRKAVGVSCKVADVWKLTSCRAAVEKGKGADRFF